jgi:hypothetical protein
MPINRIAATTRLLSFILVAMLFSVPVNGKAQSVPQSRGQTVYVPIYSHIYSGDKEMPLYLTAVCSIRNIDTDMSIIIDTVDYYDSEGKLLERYLNSALVIKPLASVRYLVKESDTKGGSGAKFIVRWKSELPVNAPLIEGVMIGTRMQQGISFVSRGIVIEERQ